MKRLVLPVIALSLAAGVVNSAAAYVGPGAGLSLVGAVWGLLVAVLAAVAFVLLWPLRRMMRRRRDKDAPTVSTAQPAQAAEQASTRTSTRPS